MRLVGQTSFSSISMVRSPPLKKRKSPSWRRRTTLAALSVGSVFVVMLVESQSGVDWVLVGGAMRSRLAAMHVKERGVSPCLRGTESPGFKVIRRPTLASR